MCHSSGVIVHSNNWPQAPDCRVLYKVYGSDYDSFQVGLSAEEMRALDAITLQQLLALLKRAQLQTRQAKSTYKGVEPRGTGFWRARFRSSNVQHSATFSTEDEAARAYDRWAMQHVGRSATETRGYRMSGAGAYVVCC